MDGKFDVLRKRRCCLGATGDINAGIRRVVYSPGFKVEVVK